MLIAGVAATGDIEATWLLTEEIEWGWIFPKTRILCCRTGGIARATAKDARFGKYPPPLDLLGQQPGSLDVTGSGYPRNQHNRTLIDGPLADQDYVDTHD